MSERTEFDDLARRKLEEREFRFNEADWLEAQRLIAQQRSSGTRRTWLMGAGLVLIGISAWFLNADRSIGQESASVAVIETGAKSNDPALLTSTDREPTAIKNHNTDTPSNGTTSVEPSSSVDAIISTGPASNVEVLRTNTKREGVSSSRQQRRPGRNTPRDGGTTLANRAALAPAAVQGSSAASVAAESNMPGEEAVAATVTHAEPVIDRVVASSSTVTTMPEVGDPNTTTGSEQPFSDGPASPTPAAEPGVPPTTLSNAKTTDRPTNGTQGPAAEPSTADTSTTTTASSVVSNDPASAQDSASTTAAVPPPPPLITPDSPWEIGVLFGGLLSRSTYMGGNSAEWIDGQTGHWSPAFGGEVMHMGRNFGIGSGLHYSTYAEDLHITERSLTTTVIQDSNYFESFHTTILHVVGNVVINNEQYYVTESHDTTLNILVLGTTSHTTTRKLIDARDVTNRVSYLEVPLLLDAHVVQGAWAIGLRGGPTVGLLNGRRGAVPNAAFDGYTDFATEQFRSPVFGFTARAYLRYRCVNGWSIGMEPTWRGHFGNVLDSGDLTRKSSAVGGMLSVSYRLR